MNTPITRRHLLHSAALLAAATTLGAPRAASLAGVLGKAAHADEDYFEWALPQPGLFVATGGGGNSTLFTRGDGAVLIDCKNAPYGESLYREAMRRCKRLAAVINTHHHGDHTGGNHALTAHAPIIAHDNCTPRVLAQMNRYLSQTKEAAMQLKEGDSAAIQQVRKEALALYARATTLKVTDFAPKTTFAKEHKLEASEAGTELILRYEGVGHTDNDITVHSPELNVLVVGDLLFHKIHPFIDAASGASTVQWQQRLREAIARCDADTIVVPGHGTLTDRAGLEQLWRYFEQAREAVSGAIKAGKTRMEVAQLSLENVTNFAGKERAGTGLQAIYDELRPAAAPTAGN